MAADAKPRERERQAPTLRTVHIYCRLPRPVMAGDRALCGHVCPSNGTDLGAFDAPRAEDCAMCLYELGRP